jgi:hypothetical protein
MALAQHLSLMRTLFARWQRHALIKIVGITIFITLFFIGYFHILRSPSYEVMLMPLTALDRLVGFQPPAVIAYLSLWFYVGIPPSLFLSLRELVRYGYWVAALCLTGLACFYLWPTAVPPHPLAVSDFPGFELLRGIDAPGNACPSLHVATAVFSAIWLHRILRELGAGSAPLAINWCWLVLIAYSTLATKQHVVLDMLAGLVLGTAFALVSIRYWPHPVSQPLSCPLD